jgi:cytochrome P450
MPLIDLLFRHNPVLMWLERRGWYQGSTFPGVPIALQRLRERQRRYDAGLSKGGAEIREDLLDQFLKARQENPSVLTEQEVLGLSLSMMIAGSETTQDTTLPKMKCP